MPMGFGGLIGKIHTGGTSGWNYSSGSYSIDKVTFSYLINFPDNGVDVLGNAPGITASNSNSNCKDKWEYGNNKVKRYV